MNQYFFIDSRVTASLYNVNTELKLSKITKETTANPLFVEGWDGGRQLPWEVRYDNAYPTVLYDPEADIYRCYYTLFIEDGISEETPLSERPNVRYSTRTKRRTALGYAESKDGLNWTKPDLHLQEFNGSTANNLIFKDAHGTGVFYDQYEINPDKRFKMITKVDYSHTNTFVAYAFSADGIHFTKPKRWPKYNPEADSHNFILFDEERMEYQLITRIWADGIRVSALSTSQDFINWSEPIEIFRGDGYKSQVYSMPTIKTGDIYLGFPSMYHAGDVTQPDYDRVDVELTYSTDLHHWNRLFAGNPFIPRGKGIYGKNADFDAGCIFSSAPIEKNGKLYFYYMGGNGQHTSFRETGLGRGFIDKDTLTYYTGRNDDQTSHLLTKNFNFYGNELIIIADIEDDGYLNVSLGNLKDETLPEFSSSNLIPLGHHRYKVQFDISLETLGMKAVSIHFDFQKTKLYGLEGTVARS